MRLPIVIFAGFVLLTNLTAAQEAVPGEYIVRFKSLEHAKNFYASSPSRSLGQYKMLTRRIAPIGLIKTSHLRATYSALNQDPNVAYMEPNYIYKIPATRTPLDTTLTRAPTNHDFSKLWGLVNKGQLDGLEGTDINALKAWKVTKGHKKIKIAIIDTGVDYTHPDLKDNMWRNPGEIAGNGVDDDKNGYVDDVFGYDFANDDPDPMDDNRHGTHCAGTIGASHNAYGVAGVMADVQLMAVKFLGGGSGGTLASALKAIEYATLMGAHVMSNSWGGAANSKALFEAIKIASERGIIFVAAAGNDNSDNDLNPTYPASYKLPNVIAVSAMDAHGNKSIFSNYGATSVHVAAPGTAIYSTIPGGNYEALSGTSMAAPHVSGIVGLVLAKNGSRSISSMRQRLIFATTKTQSNLSKASVSQGYVDAFAAIMGRESDR